MWEGARVPTPMHGTDVEAGRVTPMWDMKIWPWWHRRAHRPGSLGRAASQPWAQGGPQCVARHTCSTGARGTMGIGQGENDNH